MLCRRLGAGLFCGRFIRHRQHQQTVAQLQKGFRLMEKLFVLLRAPWMYDLPGDGLPLRGNLPLNLLQAAQNGTPVRFSLHDHRGVSWVRETNY